MSTTQSPFSIVKQGWQGVPVVFTITIWATMPATDGTGGVPEDISEWVFMLTVKKNYTDPDTDAVYLNDWKIAPGAGLSGTQTFEVPAEITATKMSAASFPVDLKAIRKGNTEPEMVISGKIVIGKTVGIRATPQLPP
jgi:hypothetical protein